MGRVLLDFRTLEYLASVTSTDEKSPNVLLPGVGGIETEAVMLGMPVTLTLPEVVGCELTGTAGPLATPIDIVLSITKVSQLSDEAKFVTSSASGV